MIHAVIMAGGGGTRFWPHSRRRRPKQLLNITGRKTMIRMTVDRIATVIPFERIMVVAGSSHVEEIKHQTPELRRDRIIAEPFGRNTAPCIALTAYKLVEEDPEAVMAVLPADHLIGKEAGFCDALRLAADTVAQNAYLLTFGIVPDRPETGYGYIRIGAPLGDGDAETVRRVDRFVEKPDLDTARSYVASGEYMWNSGMFVWKASDIIAALEEHLPDMSREIRNVFNAAAGEDPIQGLNRRV